MALKKRVLAVILTMMILVAGSVTVASAKTVSGTGWKWKYGESVIGTSHYSEYYKKNGIHSSRVTFDCGKTDYAMSYGDDFPGDNGWSNASKSCLKWHSEYVHYYRNNSL